MDSDSLRDMNGPEKMPERCYDQNMHYLRLSKLVLILVSPSVIVTLTFPVGLLRPNPALREFTDLGRVSCNLVSLRVSYLVLLLPTLLSSFRKIGLPVCEIIKPS